MINSSKRPDNGLVCLLFCLLVASFVATFVCTLTPQCHLTSSRATQRARNLDMIVLAYFFREFRTREACVRTHQNVSRKSRTYKLQRKDLTFDSVIAICSSDFRDQWYLLNLVSTMLEISLRSWVEKELTDRIVMSSIYSNVIY